jgi:hypothetical protein
MLFTYSNAIPSNNRPSTNIDTQFASGPKNNKSGHAKANPIKHWRKQLMPLNPTSSTQVSISQMDNPSVSIITNDSDNKHTVYNQVISITDCLGVNTENGCVGGTNNIRRTATTVLSKKYCSSTKQYLQRRGKSYEQNQTLGKQNSAYSYNSAIPSHDTIVHDTDDYVCKTVIFKPNNETFRTQGAVTSAGYTAKIKQDSLGCSCAINSFDPLKKTQQPCCSTCCMKTQKLRQVVTHLL